MDTRRITHTIRPADPDDAPSVARIHVESWHVAYRGLMPDEVIARMDLATRTGYWGALIADRAWPVFVLAEEGQLVGFCHICAPRDPDLERGRVGEISALHVLPDLRGGGRGAALFRHATGELARRGLAGCALWVLEQNQPARLFYEKMGMKLDGARKTHPGSAVPEVRYRLALSSATRGESSSARSS